LVEPSGRLVAAVARGRRCRARVVGVGTSLAMALTAIGASALVARATGWGAIAMVVLLLCSAGLDLLDPYRTRPITRPTLRIAGAIALSLLAISGTVALVDAVATIV